MALKQRQAAMREIEKLRGGRRVVALCTFDRLGGQNFPGLAINFQEDMKEPLYRVLKETLDKDDRLDLFLYTRGGDTNAVWPIVSLLREYDSAFEVLVPFRAHSAGTMVALAAKTVLMTPLAELSPIDPTTANQFNPKDKAENMLGIGVEDVKAYQDFWEAVFNQRVGLTVEQKSALLQPYLSRLATEIHPLALGNVNRVHKQTRILAKMLLAQHHTDEIAINSIIERLTQEYYSHNHMINREEAMSVLGKDHVSFADATLTSALDKLLRQYEDDFELRHAFFLNRFMGDDAEKEARLIAGSVESAKWSYLYETKMKVRQYLNPPTGIQIQVPVGVVPPLVPGLPRKYESQIIEQSWVRNPAPKGVTL